MSPCSEPLGRNVVCQHKQQQCCFSITLYSSFPMRRHDNVYSFVILYHVHIYIWSYLTCQHRRMNDVFLAPRIWFVTHWVQTRATVAALVSPLRLQHHPLAFCINRMIQHAKLWQLPLFIWWPQFFFFYLEASWWSELTHNFLPRPKKRKKKKIKNPDLTRSHVHCKAHWHLNIWPGFSRAAVRAVTLAL